jgi:hypothetical protein
MLIILTGMLSADSKRVAAAVVVAEALPMDTERG